MKNTHRVKKTKGGVIIAVLFTVLTGCESSSNKATEPNANANTHTEQNNPVQSKPAAEQENNNNKGTANSGFAMAGEWYFNDAGAIIKYVFSEPQMVNGTLHGQLDMLMDGYFKGGPVNYAVEENNKLKLSETDNSATWWENFFYDPNTQTLSLTNEEGVKRTFYRTLQSANNAAAGK